MAQAVYLVTGSMGCIGAWALYHLVKQGKTAVSYDLSTRRDRLNLLLTPAEQEAIHFITGDLTQSAHVMQTFAEQGITHIIHLGALQVPLVRANPILGAQVNVVGTANLLEAAKQHGVKHLAYASSIAVYGAANRYPDGLIAPDAPLDPHTLYGVYKQANELAARNYWEEYGISSAALRPYIVYGVGRDQGMTSEPTKAMLSIAAGKPHHIGFGGVSQYQSASDTALQFIAAAETVQQGAVVCNLGGKPTAMAEVVELLKMVRPNAKVTFDDKPLPFPLGFDDTPLRQHFQTVYETPLLDGIAQTIEHFERCLAEGLIAPPA